MNIYGPECFCPNCATKKSIQGFGPEDAEVMAIGIAPGRGEIAAGRPFVGPAGKRFNDILRACGFSRDQVYCTNLIGWWKDSPTFDEIESCWPRLAEEISERKPRLILALGALASEWLTGYKVGRIRGGILRPEDMKGHLTEVTHKSGLPLTGDDVAVMATWHPAATLPGRNPALAGDLVRDFKKIRRYLAGELASLTVRTHMVRDRQHAQEVLYWLSGRSAALDVETTFDTPTQWGRLLCLSIATRLAPAPMCPARMEDEYVSYVFPREVLDGLTWPSSIRWGFHNGPFDRNVVRRELRDARGKCVDLRIDWDTMQLSYSCDERPGYDRDDKAVGSSSGGGRNKSIGPGYHSLDQLGREYLSAGFFKDDTKDWIGQDPDELVSSDGWKHYFSSLYWDEAKPKLEEMRADRWQKLYTRNALDAAYTIALPQRLPGGSSAPCYQHLLIPTTNAYADVQRTGIRIDVPRLLQLESEWRAEHTKMEVHLEEWAADLGFKNPPRLKRDLDGPPFNPASPKQLAELLFDPKYLAIKSKVRTKKAGNPSTAEEVLIEVAERIEADAGGDFVRELLRMRKYFSVLKYLPILRANIRPDGRVHPTFLPLVTGRYSAVDPNMQNFPQPYKLVQDGVPELAVLRSVIIPSDGMVFIASDYSQLEIYCGAWLSGDETMKADLDLPFPEAGKPDYHSRVTREVLACAAEYGSDEWEKVRRGAKVFTFGIEFGERAKGLARNASKEMGTRMSERTAEKIITAWYARYATFRSWQRDQIRSARQKGYIENPFGFVRRFPLADGSMENQMVNCAIQGTASQHCTIAMVDLVNPEYFAGTQHYRPDPRPPLSTLGGNVLLTIHDDILSEVPEDRVPEALKLIKEVMETPRIPGWPGMQAEQSIGRDWHMMKKGAK